MENSADDRSSLPAEHMTILAEAIGIAIAPERLPDATAALAELLALDSELDTLTLGGIDPGEDDVSWPENRS